MPLKRSGAAAILAIGCTVSPSSAATSDPTKAECIAANEHAQDLQGEGKLRDARAQLAVCVAESCPGPVRQDCAQRLAEVDKAMPTLVLAAKDAAGNDLGNVRVTVDGHPFLDKLNGTAIAVDPGEHRFVFEAAGLAAAEKTLVLHEGEKGRREAVVFGPAPTPTQAAAPTPTPTASSEPASPGAEPRGTEEKAADGSTQRIVGLALGGAGALGVVLGGVFGLVSKSTYDHALATECGAAAHNTDPKACSGPGVSDVQSANGQATVSTIAFIGGAVLFGAGALVYFTAPRAAEVSVAPAVGERGAGLSIQGRWW